MKLRIIFPMLFVAVIAVSSCVSTGKYKDLQARYDKLDSNTREMKGKYLLTERNLAIATDRVKSLDDQLASERANNKQLQNALDKCLTSSGQGNLNISKLVDEINRSNRYIQELVNAKNKSDSLNMVLTNNLTRSLNAQEAQDVDVKVLKGVVYISLADNMLYKSGSYEISDKAGATLSKIAKIIKDYNNYDVLIEGNTDNVPISQKNIRNNWDLSALRASSVVMALQTNYQVDPKRLTAGGRGEYNPIADNNTPNGKAQNRRTQIIITPKLDQFMDLIGKAPENQPAKQ
ncbi:OmpA/MotB family protein [Mucilaginibacter conchicola]|nr:flagellar motor protein MotB [Mucilaginibacter conchicola]